MDLPQRRGENTQPAGLPSPSDRERRPIPDQAHGHAGVLGLGDAMFQPANATGNRGPNEGWGDMSPPIENVPAQAELQGIQHVIGDNAGFVQDVPAQAHVTPPTLALVSPPLTPLDDLLQIPYGQATEPLWLFAALYLHDRNSQVAGVQIEPSQHEVDAVTVAITLSLTPFPNGWAAEVLRELAIAYLHDRSSQVTGIRMDYGQADGLVPVVVITLRMTRL